MAIQIHLCKGADGFYVVNGHMRLQALLSMQDEVKVEAPGIGEVLIAKLPDGRLVVTQDNAAGGGSANRRAKASPRRCARR